MYGSIMRARVKPGRRPDYERLVHELVPSADDYGRGLHSVEVAWESGDPEWIDVEYGDYVGRALGG